MTTSTLPQHVTRSAVTRPCQRPGEISTDEWDAFVASHPEGYQEQTSGYAEHRAQYGFECDRVIIREGGGIIGGAQVLVQPTPLGRHARVLRAPLAVDNDVLRKVIEQLEELAIEKSYVSMRVDTFPNQWAARTALDHAGFHPSSAWFGERPSCVVPLRYSDDELLSRVRQRKARYNIRLAQREGVEVRLEDGECIGDFYTLRSMSVEHNGHLIFPQSYYQYIWNLFRPSKRVQLLVAHHDGEPLATLFNAMIGDRMYLIWLGTNRDEELKKLKAGYLLHYEALVHARNAGCTLCDFIGVSDFKKRISRDEIQWPLPQWKFFGAFRSMWRQLLETAWSRPRIRYQVNKMARFAGLRPSMPY
jgi:peptidoglycan pentaglycine glycine transferase (the first glycine)